MREMPERVVVKSMWDEGTGGTSLVWAAEGHEFQLEELPRQRATAEWIGTPHPLRPRGTADRNAIELSALEEQLFELSSGGYNNGEGLVHGDGQPPRLEIRASFDTDGFVVAMVFGKNSTSWDVTMVARGPGQEAASKVSWRGEGSETFRIQQGKVRVKDSIDDPLVSAEELPGHSPPRHSRIKACAEAMALTVWREAAAAGMSPALPAFVAFVATAARKALSSTVPEAGAATAQMVGRCRLTVSKPVLKAPMVA